MSCCVAVAIATATVGVIGGGDHQPLSDGKHPNDRQVSGRVEELLYIVWLKHTAVYERMGTNPIRVQ